MTHMTLLTWPDYLAPSTLERFRIETGATVDLDIVPSAVELLARMRQTDALVDLLCPPDYAARELIAEGLLLELEADHIPNRGNLGDGFADRPHDPGDRFTVPKDWGTTGYLVRRDRLPHPGRSWADFWALAGDASGHVTLLDSPGEVIGAALKRRGHSYNCGDDSALARAAQDLLDLLPHLLSFTSDYRPLWQSGQAWLSLGWNGDAIALQQEGLPVTYIIPEEGSQIWEDDWAIAKRSREPEAAHRFLDFVLRPDIAAEEALYTGYATPNREALDRLPAARRDDPVIYPPADVLARLERGIALDPAARELRAAIWSTVRQA